MIPNIIESDDKTFATYILDNSPYITEVNNKMHEELVEYEGAITSDNAVEELADLLELIHTAAKFHGVTVGELGAIRAEKAAKRGGFEERIYLVEAEDD
ncbi:hypothetical protein SLU01_11790 [Sporosarcina luteola]|uniref:Phosphoribosyl-ATP pyrophosphohydrolase n=1 Tax=Sporosarcina luteola TaxID=582850 RepID=A0A511Z5Z0_9BACL|nr:nucleoside triphosphate pyrophosphohydrolase [Sporosarcina luteola]GEN82867.1 hypothetical protein SLU01_11790 [Sporosarcina luteola]